MRRLLFGMVASLFAASAFGAEFFNIEPIEVNHFELGTPVTSPGTRVGGIYDNTANFLGQAFANGGSGIDSGSNVITRLVADDLGTIHASNALVTQFTFAVANLNATPVSARARVRFWTDTAGAPGAYYNAPAGGAISGAIGFSFNPFTFAPGVTLLTGTVSSFVLTPGILWAGLTFDNNNGGTGATAAQMDNLGSGLFDPPVEGTSNDGMFRTNTFGSFFTTNNPAGAAVNFGGNPVANVGWQIIPEPTSLALLALGALAMVRRR
jgi:hypothetical protein